MQGTEKYSYSYSWTLHDFTLDFYTLINIIFTRYPSCIQNICLRNEWNCKSFCKYLLISYSNAADSKYSTSRKRREKERDNVIVGISNWIWLFIFFCKRRAYQEACTRFDGTAECSAAQVSIPAAGTAVHLLIPAVAGTLSRMLFDNSYCNYSLLANKNQFLTYFHFTFSADTLQRTF